MASLGEEARGRRIGGGKELGPEPMVEGNGS